MPSNKPRQVLYLLPSVTLVSVHSVFFLTDWLEFSTLIKNLHDATNLHHD